MASCWAFSLATCDVTDFAVDRNKETPFFGHCVCCQNEEELYRWIAAMLRAQVSVPVTAISVGISTRHTTTRGVSTHHCYEHRYQYPAGLWSCYEYGDQYPATTLQHFEHKYQYIATCTTHSRFFCKLLSCWKLHALLYSTTDCHKCICVCVMYGCLRLCVISIQPVWFRLVMTQPPWHSRRCVYIVRASR